MSPNIEDLPTLDEMNLNKKPARKPDLIDRLIAFSWLLYIAVVSAIFIIFFNQ